MKQVLVSSSVLRAVGYDDSTATLEVEFHTGSIYEYHAVPSEVHAALMSAASKGRYFDARIRKNYDCRRVF